MISDLMRFYRMCNYLQGMLKTSIYHIGMEDVGGSIPPSSTKKYQRFRAMPPEPFFITFTAYLRNCETARHARKICGGLSGSFIAI